METFCGYMNMPRPMAITTYNDIVKNIHGVYMETAAESMQYAAEEIREENLAEEFSEDAIGNVAISADDTWQRRGYFSLNEAVTIIGIDNGKRLDFEVLSKVCQAYETREPLKGTSSFDEFMKTHHMVQLVRWRHLEFFSAFKDLRMIGS